MQRDPGFYYGEAGSSHAYGAGGGYNAPTGGGYNYNTSLPPAAVAAPAGMEHMDFLSGVNFQASEVCPKNFIIFDQADDGNRVMFHPAFAQKFNGSSSFGFGEKFSLESGRGRDKDKEYGSSSIKEIEDPEDIDALLSIEDEDEDEDDDDILSTGRTPGYNMGSSPDTYSTDESNSKCKSKSKSEKQRLSSNPRSSSSSTNSNRGSERKRERMKKMVHALRGIVPGGEQMDTPAILDEAVRYLKSLKVEVKKLGIGNFNN
ncbi:hypothetical protein QJS10_CPA03g00658 [Acorus calamus]|uniref:BHLH domain-containing protein n=1 Tax=Acorus calamus TaxID=4465 RepID=A0AAV9F9M8_ACOCL|nr:hypothetical protein QJS10_CPA03g00658 [Acorus calamus]